MQFFSPFPITACELEVVMQNGCEFLTKEALEKGGGDKIMYW